MRPTSSLSMSIWAYCACSGNSDHDAVPFSLVRVPTNSTKSALRT
ncbi:Uncharacterised protein [Bordetella pertussis]|nr:Uncharacterised protein [Bordetella pertussis]CFW29623.1 Uncharacterised protein [Bordetella pertussis]